MKINKKIIRLSSLAIIIALGIVITTKVDSKDFLKNSKSINSEQQKTILNKTNDNIVLEVTMESSYRTGSIEELYNDSAVVLIAEYLSDVKTDIKTTGNPNTYSSFKVKKILKNESEQKINDTIIARRMGGTVTLKELLDVRSPEYAKKMGVDNLSEEQINTSLVKFTNNDELGDKSLNECKTRLLLLNYDKETNDFVIMQNDYGMLSYDENTNTAFDVNGHENIQYSFLK